MQARHYNNTSVFVGYGMHMYLVENCELYSCRSLSVVEVWIPGFHASFMIVTVETTSYTYLRKSGKVCILQCCRFSCILICKHFSFAAHT